MEMIKPLIPFLIIEYLAVFATIFHIIKNKETRIFSWSVWIFIVFFFNLIGMLLYFTIGREEE